MTAAAISLCPVQRRRRHRLRLPGFDVVAGDLDVADRLAEVSLHFARSIAGAYGEQGDLVVEVDEALDDDAARIDPAAARRVVPGLLHVVRPAQQRLALAGRRHHRLDDARVADAAVDGGLQFGQRVGEAVGRGRQAEFLGGQAADAFAVHRQAGGARGGDDLGQPGGFDLDQGVGGDGLDFRHDEVRLFLFDQRAQRRAVGHRMTWARWATCWPGAFA